MLELLIYCGDYSKVKGVVAKALPLEEFGAVQ